MRKWLVGAGVLLLVTAIVLAVALANVKVWLGRNREWLTAQAEAAIGRPVRFDAVRASIRGGLGVELTNVRIADDPAFSDGDFARARSVLVRVKVLPALEGYDVGGTIEAHLHLQGPLGDCLLYTSPSPRDS